MTQEMVAIDLNVSSVAKVSCRRFELITAAAGTVDVDGVTYTRTARGVAILGGENFGDGTTGANPVSTTGACSVGPGPTGACQYVPGSNLGDEASGDSITSSQLYGQDTPEDFYPGTVALFNFSGV